MPNKLQNYLEQAEKFIGRLVLRLEEDGFQTFVSSVDHVCYRVANLASYEDWKSELAAVSVLLTESYVNGRPIAVFKLKKPLLVGDFVIDLIELPAPKPGRQYQEGFEHIEVVVKESLEELLQKNPSASFDVGNLNAQVNRDVQIEYDEGLIKFHEASLESIITEEKLAVQSRTRKNLVVIDFDDTLVDSKSQFLAATHSALCEYLRVDIDFEDFRKKARPTFPDFFANFGITDSKAVQDIVTIFKEKWREHSASVTVPLGMKSALSCLRAEGVAIVIWTARDRDTTVEFIRNAGLNGYFDDIFAFDEEGTSKPVPQKELEKLARAATSVVVGDSNSDYLGSKALGSRFLQAAWIHQAHLFAEGSTLCQTPFEFLGNAMAYFKAGASK